MGDFGYGVAVGLCIAGMIILLATWALLKGGRDG